MVLLTYILSPKQVKELENVIDILKDIAINKSYKCSVCGRAIKPKIYFENGEICIDVNKNSIRSGIGNTIIQDNICDSCAKG